MKVTMDDPPRRRGLGFGILDAVLEHPVTERVVTGARRTARTEVAHHILETQVEPRVNGIFGEFVRRRRGG